MRILFVYPRIEKLMMVGNTPPTAALSLASFIQREGHEVRIYERNIDKKSVSHELGAFQPDVIVCTLMFLQQIRDMQSVCREIRSLRPNLPVLCGGLTASILPELILKEGLADYVGVAEGEYTLLELLEVVAGQREPSTVQSLVYPDPNGQPVRTPLRPFAELRDFPDTDFSLLPMEKYIVFYPQSPRTLSVTASKGCPGQCTFCFNAAYHRCQYRARKRESVLREIETLATDYNADGIKFFDELWGLDKEELYAYCDGIAALGEKTGKQLRWFCETRIGVLEPEDLRRMADAGCWMIEFGVESGSPEILGRMKKGYPLGRLEKDFHACKAVGISTMALLIFGFPDETPAQIKQSIHILFRLNPTYYATVYFTAFPNTAEYNKLVASGRVTPPADFASWAGWEIMQTMSANYSAVPNRELKVITNFFLWRMLFQNLGKRKISFKIIGMVLRMFADQMGRKGFFRFFFKHFHFVLDVAWHYYAYPGIRKKYDLYPRNFGRKDWEDLSHLDSLF